MISTLLIANRGEIALRVIRAARGLGIRTAAVYSDADARAPHVRAADVAYRIGPAPAASSYLDITALLHAARAAGADAVHPGYGFLSESATFARAVTGAGLTWVGPPPEVIERMGRKDSAREAAVKAGVPIVPSGEDAEFPVLVKAAAGGGGKGMRVVRSQAELVGAIEAARREAASAFGDDTVLIERYVERGRHVEVQVLADQHGNVVHLYERDCSVQRRHQKVIEEAPAPTLSAATRALLLDAAVALAREIGYTNAGTVEFLVSGDEFYFLEMNTRLQVEHPVTEAVTGLDLVRLQLQIAAGEPLPVRQEEVRCTGHAIEARIYAEDAFHGFLPQAGVARLVQWPPGVRVDAALESGQEVGTAYDPMLAKVVVHGPDRESARRRLIEALDQTVVVGLTTNVGFLRVLAASDPFRDCAIDTAWLDSHSLAPPPPEAALQRAAWALADAGRTDDSPFGVGDGWRLGAPPAPVLVSLADRLIALDGPRPAQTSGAVLVSAGAVDVVHHGQWYHFDRSRADSPAAGLVTDGTVAAPMPGTVLSVEVAEGDEVEPGQVLGVLEAMKMQYTLTAPVAGTVVRVDAVVGAQVALRDPLFTIEGPTPG